MATVSSVFAAIRRVNCCLSADSTAKSVDCKSVTRWAWIQSVGGVQPPKTRFQPFSDFQHGRDKIKTPFVSKVPDSMSTYLGRPAYIIHCTATVETTPTLTIDVTSLVRRAAELLGLGAHSPWAPRAASSLERMCWASRSVQRTDAVDLRKIPVFGKEFFLFYWETDFLKMTKWLGQFDGFHKLPQAVQLQVVMATWHIRARLERLAMTARLRRNERIREQDFMIDPNACFDLKNCKLDISWCTKYSPDQIKFFIEDSDDWVHNQVVHHLEDLSPTDIEITFMMCQLCFHYAGKRFQGDVLSAMDQFEDVISDDLHNYYRQMDICNYSERLAKMMKINNQIQKVIWEKRWKTDLAKKFDIFYVTFSHPEMFTDCC